MVSKQNDTGSTPMSFAQFFRLTYIPQGIFFFYPLSGVQINQEGNRRFLLQSVTQNFRIGKC